MTPRVVASGLSFPEGPSLLPDGSVAVVEMQGGSVYTTGSRGRLAGLGGGPNGSAVGTDGTIYVANNGGLSATSAGGYWHAEAPFDGRVQRIAADGTVSTL